MSKNAQDTCYYPIIHSNFEKVNDEVESCRIVVWRCPNRYCEFHIVVPKLGIASIL